MKITVSPSEAALGDDVTIHGEGFEPDAMYRVTVTYADRSESFKSMAAGDEHPEFKAGVLDYTIRAERPGDAQVVLWDYGMFHQVAEAQFTVKEG